MQLIQNGTQGPTSVPAKQVAAGTPGYAYGGPPGATPSSIWDADMANTIIAELINIVVAAGITLDAADNGQVLKALRRIGFPTGLATLGSSTTLTGANAGNFYNVGGSATTQTLNNATFTSGQTIGFLAQSACTIATSTGFFYGGTLSGASIAMGVGSLVALEWDGVNWRQLAGTFFAAKKNAQAFTSSGTWTVPAGVTSARVRVWGAGGGSGGTFNAATAGAPGAAGGYAESILTGLTPGTAYAVTVGLAGTGGVSIGGGSGTGGGSSSFSSLLSATGGNGGLGSVSGSVNTVAAAGSGTGGNVMNITGGVGSCGFALGGGSMFAAQGGAAPLGGPQVGGGASSVSANNGPGIFPGGGAGGSVNQQVGLAGAGGLVIVEW